VWRQAENTVGREHPASQPLPTALQILRDPLTYGSNTLYITGDILYAVGAYAYVLASLRDDGWFWFMPGGGKLPYGDDGVPMPAPASLEPPEPETLASWFLGGCMGLALVGPCRRGRGQAVPARGPEGTGLLDTGAYGSFT